MRRALVLAFVFLAMAACGEKSNPAPPSSPPTTPPSTPTPDPPGTIRVTANDVLGWSQPALNTADLARFQYVVYIDGTRTALSGATCNTATAPPAGFECTAPMPPLSNGQHTLEVASFVTEGGTILESSRTATLNVIFGTAGGLVPSPAETRFTTAEGSELMIERIFEGLVDPSDLAFASDGVIFVAERGGRVQAIRNGVPNRDLALDVSSEIALPAGGLLAIALDPKFSETGFLYALYAAKAPHDNQEFVLARFRGVRDVFGERAVLLDRVPASPAGASGALRIGADGKVYVALDSAADSATSGSLASYNGKVLRFNADATVPLDQPLATPVYSLNHPQPRAFDWQPASGRLWVVDELNAFAGRLSRTDGDLQPRSSPRVSYALPEGTGPASAAFYRGDLLPQFKGDLFIAAAAGRQLIRLRFDPAEPGRVASVDRLLQDAVGPVRVVAPGPDGALYLTSDTALYRMRPVN